ncbi:hypothetical protein [Desulfohalovibrio reitneri]|uniref:hypothetical protein n=1 Tax=Desulfohalovibrio reitneri TaxID=1307759 RepID=UPI0004A71DBD|nr:hypothetical protein [Desulfohalovibrio reitneri]
MIDKVNAIDTVLTRLDKLEPGQALDLRTYKRNRSVVILKRDAERLTVVQDGYEKNTFEITRPKLKKTLKTLLKKEFPRSTKVRLYTLDEYTPGQERVKLKEL